MPLSAYEGGSQRILKNKPILSNKHRQIWIWMRKKTFKAGWWTRGTATYDDVNALEDPMARIEKLGVREPGKIEPVMEESRRTITVSFSSAAHRILVKLRARQELHILTLQLEAERRMFDRSLVRGSLYPWLALDRDSDNRRAWRILWTEISTLSYWTIHK